MDSRKASRVKKTRSARITAENRAGMIAILLVVCLLFAVLLFEGERLRRRIGENEQKRIELQQALEEEELRTGEIESRREFLQSDEYVRQAAKDRLGLVESGEMIFKQKNQT